MIRTLSALAICLATPLLAQRIQLTPIDQAVRDPSLLAFRAKLPNDVVARDTEAVIASTCEQIYLSHGGNGGHDELRQYLTLPEETLSEEYRSQAPAMREAYWQDLEKTLRQPGYFESNDEFWMPFHWQIDLPEELDAFEAYFVTGSHVTLRSEPHGDAHALAWISHEVVTIEEFDPDKEYQEVRIGDGRTGHMHRDYLWAIVGYRASFIKTDDNNWTLCSFVAGD